MSWSVLESLAACIRARLEEQLKPHLSLWTMVTVLLLIFMLVASKAEKVAADPMLAARIFGAEAWVLLTLLGVTTLVDRLLGMSYEDHMAIAFVSATKNASVAAAIAVTALGPMAALPAALIPVIQAPVVISYMHLSHKIRRLFTVADRRAAALQQPG
jgi:ACR3 family arsenite transporter